MGISPTYANRNDLSTFEKFQFTLEERISRNAALRAAYRWFDSLPDTVMGTLVAVWIATGIIPLVLAALCEAAVQKIIGDSGEGEGIGLLLYVALLGLLVFLHPLAWVLVTMTFFFVAGLWFAVIMDDYKRELRKK